MKAITKDGKKVKVGDKVWVIGSCGVFDATVLEPVTNYELFGPISVSRAYSTEEAAKLEAYHNETKN